MGLTANATNADPSPTTAAPSTMIKSSLTSEEAVFKTHVSIGPEVSSVIGSLSFVIAA